METLNENICPYCGKSISSILVKNFGNPTQNLNFYNNDLISFVYIYKCPSFNLDFITLKSSKYNLNGLKTEMIYPSPKKPFN